MATTSRTVSELSPPTPGTTEIQKAQGTGTQTGANYLT